MRMFLSFVVLLCTLTGYGCEGKGQKENRNEEVAVEVVADKTISGISALYYNYVLEDEQSIDPDKLQKSIPDFKIDRKGVLDAAITDSAKLARIQDLIDVLQPLPQSKPVDGRIVVTIGRKDGTTDRLCIGGQYTDRIFLNGVEQERNNRLLFMLKNYIGFYPWMIGDDMFHMAEMRDNSFPKDPFISTKYYKDYQKALSER